MRVRSYVYLPVSSGEKFRFPTFPITIGEGGPCTLCFDLAVGVPREQIPFGRGGGNFPGIDGLSGTCSLAKKCKKLPRKDI